MCYTDADMTNLIPLVTQWVREDINFHFNSITHLDVNCGPHKDMAKKGLQPTVKVIYLPKKLIPQAKIIIQQLNKYLPEFEEDEFEQRHPRMIMMCSVCGINIKEQ